MSTYVGIQPIEDLVVYGQVQSAFFTVDNPSALLAYDQACTTIALKRAATVETELVPMKIAIGERSQKIADLGKCYEHLAAWNAWLEFNKVQMTDKTPRNLDTVPDGNPLSTISFGSITSKYEVKLDDTVFSRSTATYQEIAKLMQTVKLEIDKEGSALERDNSATSAWLKKCNSSYSLVQTLQKKIDGTAGRTIAQLGN